MVTKVYCDRCEKLMESGGSFDDMFNAFGNEPILCKSCKSGLNKLKKKFIAGKL